MRVSLTASTRREMAPSLSSRVSPACTSLGSSAIGAAHPVDVAGVGTHRGVEEELGALDELDGTGAEALDADLGALQVAEDTDVPVQFARHLARGLGAAHLLLGAAMGEIDAHHIDTRLQQTAQHAGIVGGRPECGDNFGSAIHLRTL